MSVEQVARWATESEIVSPVRILELKPQWQAAGGSSEDDEAFLDWLVEMNLVTGFQAETLRAELTVPHRLGPYDGNALDGRIFCANRAKTHER